MDETETVASFRDLDRGDRAAEMLREADIDVEIDEVEPPEAEPSGGDDPQAGVVLRVGADGGERARELLEQEYGSEVVVDEDWAEETPFSDTSPEEEEEWQEMTEGIHCPNCGGKDLGLGTPLFQALGTAVVVSFAAVFLIPAGYRQYGIAVWGLLLLAFLYGLAFRRFHFVCKECGYTGPRRDFDPTRS